MGDMKSGVVEPLKALDEIATWERVWIEVVARAWRDKTFREKLLADDGRHARAVIKDEFGHELASDVELRVVAAEEHHPRWSPEDRRHARATTKLVLTLPHAPKDVNDYAIALSHYVAGGYSMPFTCCC